jgi:hypothetical protein
MKRMIASVLVLILVMAFSTFTVAYGAPLKENSNPKFQSFSVIGTYDVRLQIFGFDHQYIPSEDKVNKLVVSGNEVFLSYQITVGDNVYLLNEDFTYYGYLKITYIDPVFPHPNPAVGNLWPADERLTIFTVDYSYNFLPASGIEGELRMHAVSIDGKTHINSLSGTGDFRNVNINAMTLPPDVSGAPFIVIFHEGRVSGWPE